MIKYTKKYTVPNWQVSSTFMKGLINIGLFLKDKLLIGSIWKKWILQ